MPRGGRQERALKNVMICHAGRNGYRYSLVSGASSPPVWRDKYTNRDCTC